MASIAGKYNIAFAVSNAQYTFTNNDRDAQFTPTSPNVVNNATCTQLNKQSFALPMYENELKIKRARLISSGAPGLQSPEGKRAAQVLLRLVSSDLTEEFCVLFLKFRLWNEWTEVNGVLRPYEYKNHVFTDGEITQHKPVYFSVGYISTYFNVDDYNLQTAYEGQTVTPILEMEMETSGMVETGNYSIF